MEGARNVMSPEPRTQADYGARQVEAARRVLVDVGQVLASFADCLVVVGGWAPDLLLVDVDEPHVGSIDVDLALDAGKLKDGRYAELLGLLLDTRRYRKGEKEFQLVVDVDLEDNERPVQVEVEFLAPEEVKLKKNRPKLIQGFRVLRVEGSGVAFREPVAVRLPGKNVGGAMNTVGLRVIALPDFLLMKAHAIGGRDKPKDTYDLCYCLEHFPGGIEALAAEWRGRLGEKHVARAVGILQEKFAGVDAFGPQQLVEFHNAPDPDMQAIHARRAYELVQRFLSLLQ
jgi:hypothetical protein